MSARRLNKRQFRHVEFALRAQRLEGRHPGAETERHATAQVPVNEKGRLEDGIPLLAELLAAGTEFPHRHDLFMFHCVTPFNCRLADDDIGRLIQCSMTGRLAHLGRTTLFMRHHPFASLVPAAGPARDAHGREHQRDFDRHSRHSGERRANSKPNSTMAVAIASSKKLLAPSAPTARPHSAVNAASD